MQFYRYVKILDSGVNLLDSSTKKHPAFRKQDVLLLNT